MEVCDYSEELSSVDLMHYGRWFPVYYARCMIQHLALLKPDFGAAEKLLHSISITPGDQSA